MCRQFRCSPKFWICRQPSVTPGLSKLLVEIVVTEYTLTSQQVLYFISICAKNLPTNVLASACHLRSVIKNKASTPYSYTIANRCYGGLSCPKAYRPCLWRLWIRILLLFKEDDDNTKWQSHHWSCTPDAVAAQLNKCTKNAGTFSKSWSYWSLVGRWSQT